MKIKKIVIAAAIGATVFVTAACGSDTATTAGNTPAAAATTSAMASETGMSSPMESSGGMSSPMESSGGMSSPMESSGGMSSPMESSGGMSSGSNDPAANLVGAGCAAYAEANPSGAGSVGGMATAKLAAAAAGNPLLTTLVAAVSGKLNPKVDLVDTLNSSEFTVFAPVDDAFKKLPAATVDTLKTDDKLLTKILTYHVIAGQLSPDQIVGTHKTLEGGEVTVTGSGDNLKVGDSTVICGGVKTANATVYLIDTVLSPPAA